MPIALGVHSAVASLWHRLCIPYSLFCMNVLTRIRSKRCLDKDMDLAPRCCRQWRTGLACSRSHYGTCERYLTRATCSVQPFKAFLVLQTVQCLRRSASSISSSSHMAHPWGARCQQVRVLSAVKRACA